MDYSLLKFVRVHTAMMFNRFISDVYAGKSSEKYSQSNDYLIFLTCPGKENQVAMGDHIYLGSMKIVQNYLNVDNALVDRQEGLKDSIIEFFRSAGICVHWNIPSEMKTNPDGVLYSITSTYILTTHNLLYNSSPPLRMTSTNEVKSSPVAQNYFTQ